MLSKTPTKGMRDFLPQEESLREYALSVIRETYYKFGFQQIETPCVEDLSLLTSKQGGENEKLIFKIMKRGEKLENAADVQEMCDLGLRYDLTVPLSRFYAAHREQLPPVFYALQIGNVWRAERPQKGRYRQFLQCDIDIFGEKTNLAETVLIQATTEALSRLGLKGFTVRVNDRRLLRALGIGSGFREEDLGKVFISLDKLDKIGRDGVKNDLTSQSFSEEAIETLLGKVEKINAAQNALEACFETVEVEPQVRAEITELFRILQELRQEYQVKFDPTLVRGMGYYTGTIFEIGMDGLGISIAGGGRYDEMLGRYLGQSVPACGFSIGFERILTLLTDSREKDDGTCYLLEKNLTAQDKIGVMKAARKLHGYGQRCLVANKIKNLARQVESLKQDGYRKIILVSAEGERILAE